MNRCFGFAAIVFVLTSSISSLSGQKLPTAKPEDVGVSADGLAKLDGFMQKLVDDNQIAGGVLMLSRHGKVVHHVALGMKDREKQIPMTTDAIFRIASMTKPITSVAIMMLSEDGKIRIDDPVSKYVPAFERPSVLLSRNPLKVEPAKREITLRHLLSHTSGLMYSTAPNLGSLYSEAGVFDGVAQSDVLLADNVITLAKVPLIFHPGEGWQYGMSIDVLARVIEVASGMTLDDFLAKRIFEPLGMRDTYFRVPEDKMGRFPAVYHLFDEPTLRRVPEGRKLIHPLGLVYSVDYPYTPNRYLSGGAGLSSTASDYMRFCQMLSNDGELGGTRLLRPRTVKMMRSNQIGDLTTDDEQKFGLGFRIVVKVDDEKHRQLLGSYSWGGYFTTSFCIVPKNDWIFVALSQLVWHTDKSLNWAREYEKLAAAAVTH